MVYHKNGQIEAEYTIVGAASALKSMFGVTLPAGSKLQSYIRLNEDKSELSIHMIYEGVECVRHYNRI